MYIYIYVNHASIDLDTILDDGGDGGGENNDDDDVVASVGDKAT